MKKRILIIDDEDCIRFTFEIFLIEEGYEVFTAKDYDEAMEQLFKMDFDLIFTEDILEAKRGVDILQNVREKNPSCHVVIVTGSPNDESFSAAHSFGAFDYICKPLRQKDLVHVTNMALRQMDN